MHVNTCLEHAQIIRMEHPLPLRERVVNIASGIAQHFLPLPTCFVAAGRKIPVGQGIARQFCVPGAEVHPGIRAIGRVDNADQFFQPVSQHILPSSPRLLDQLPELRLTFAAEYFQELPIQQAGFHGL